MTGEELLVLAAMSNRNVREAIEKELDRRSSILARRTTQNRFPNAAAGPQLVA